MRVNFQGRGHLISEYWPYLHSMIHDRNPATGKLVARIIRETPVRGVFVAEVSAKFDFGFALTAIFA